MNILNNIEKKHIVMITILITIISVSIAVFVVLNENKEIEITDKLMAVQTDKITGSVILMFEHEQITVDKLGNFFGKTPLSHFASVVENHIGKIVTVKYHLDDTCVLNYYKVV